VSTTLQVQVPDLGDFNDVPVIEILVAVGDTVEPEQSLVTLESDKATMDIPSTAAGVVRAVLVKEGDRLSQGMPVVELEVTENAQAAPEAPETPTEAGEATPGAAPSGDFDCDVLVLGAGPGGYTAAFRAADLGQRTILVERYDILGGVCLNVGCIPSKALLHTAKLIGDVAAMEAHGVRFGPPQIDLDQLRGFKDSVVDKLTGGLAALAAQRKVEVVTGCGRFSAPNELTVDSVDGPRNIRFRHAIIAAGSQSVQLPGLPWDDPRLMDSTDALELNDIPKRLLVIGGGIIGMEMASVYHALGSEVTVVEMLDTLMAGADADLVRPLAKIVKKQYANIFLSTRVTGIKALKSGLKATFDGNNAPQPTLFDRVLVAVGRTPNGGAIAAEAAGVAVDERGFIAVDEEQRTNVPHIFAIGDIVGQPMLAHKATHQGKVAAEVTAGEKSAFSARVIPSVAYTDPELAWAGITEAQAKADGIAYKKATFPWAASGRALGQGRSEGLSKLIFTPEGRIIGAGIVGPHAGDLIAECALAIEMGCDAADIALTIHPHPTLSETVAMAAEMFDGTITDLYVPKPPQGT